MENLDKKTSELNRLINANNSGKSAWKAGEMLFEIKDKNEFRFDNFKSFGDYTQQKLRINETKAYNYINIYKLFSSDSLDDEILVTHLLTLAKSNENTRELILNGLKELKDKSKNNKNNNDKALTTNQISTVVTLIETAETSDINVTSDLVTNAINIAVENAKEKIFKLPNKHGNSFSSNFFEHVQLVFPYEPTCEMDVVGLFSALFYYLRDIPFNYPEQKQFLTFEHIVYLRAPFPDAQIKLINKKQNHNHTIDIEFEFNSRTYESHLKSKKACQMIICWENNIEKGKYSQFKYPFPPILSLKKVMETGKIELE